MRSKLRTYAFARVVRRFTVVLLAAALSAAGSYAPAQTAPAPVTSVPATPASSAPIDLHKLVDDAATSTLAKSGVPSASIALVVNDAIAYAPAYGMAQLSPDKKARPEMRYSVGSISKQFTAAAILMLVEEHKLTLDDPIGRWLPDLTRAKEVTVRQVLSHTSGYQDYWPEDYVMTTMMQPTTADKILEVWGKKPLDFDPGTQWQYSNTNYVIAGRIVEQITGKPLFDFLIGRIFRPLQMESAWNQDFHRLAPTDAIGYYRHALGPLRPAPEEGFGWMFAAGELAMTAGDLAKWDIAMIDRTILKPASWDALETEVKLKNGGETHYALGVEVAMRDGHRIVFHSGEVSGFVAQNTVFPDDHFAVVVLTNQDAVSSASEIARTISRAVIPSQPQPAVTVAAAAVSVPTAGPTSPAPTSAAPISTAPDSAAAAPAAPEAAPVSASTTQAQQIFEGLQQAKIDRSLFTALCNAYFTSEAIADYASSLAPLGKIQKFTEATHDLRGGMTFHAYSVEFDGGKKVEITTYVEPDGKLEQFLVSP